MRYYTGICLKIGFFDKNSILYTFWYYTVCMLFGRLFIWEEVFVGSSQTGSTILFHQSVQPRLPQNGLRLREIAPFDLTLKFYELITNLMCIGTDNLGLLWLLNNSFLLFGNCSMFVCHLPAKGSL